MKILHTAALLRPPSGITNQMRWEQKAADNLGLDWTVKIYCPQGWMKSEPIIEQSKKVTAGPAATLKKAYNWYALRKEYYRWLKSQENHVDLYILRYYIHDPLQHRFILQCKKPVYLVFHTLEVPELALKGGVSGWIRSNLERIMGPKSIRASSGIIGVTQEIIDYQKQRSSQENKNTFLYPNGIMLDSPTTEDKRGKETGLLFVAGNFSPWHGLDLLLSGMEENSEEFKLHLVGDLPEDLKLQAERDPRIILHGRKDSNQIREIASRCHAGLSSFGLFRNHMHQACTLKVREYLMLGLPVCAGHDDVFDNSFPYFTNEGANISRILQYARKMVGTSRQQVADSAKPYIEKTELLDRLYRSLTV